MLDILTGTLAPYIAGAIGLVMLFFGVKIKVKTATIEKQKQIITSQEIDKVMLVSAIEVQKETADKMEKANEILADNVSDDDTIEWLRKRAAARDNSGKG